MTKSFRFENIEPNGYIESKGVMTKSFMYKHVQPKSYTIIVSL